MKQKMRKISGRIACLAIVLAMLLGMLPVVPASAADIHQLTEAVFADGLKSDWLDPTNVWKQNADGTVAAPAKTNTPYYFNRSNSYTMTNYTFQADVTLPAGFAANTQLGGLCFGVMDGNEAGKVSRYEFTISYIAATDTAEAGWAARVYKRSGATGDYQYNVNGSNTAVNSNITVNTDRTKETTFTMKAVVDGLTMQCYIDDVLVINKTINQTKDANYTRGAITGGVALYGFGNSTSTFSNVKLMSKNFNLPAGRWQNDGTWTYDMINDSMIAPASNSVHYINKSSYVEMSDYVFQTDVILPENANANTQLGGIVFGSQDASGVTSRYEFTVTQTANGWCPRLYKRVSGVEGYGHYTCAGNHTTVNSNVQITAGVPFTMRVVLNGLTAACYINDVLVFNFQVTKTTDAALAQGKIMGAVGLLGFKNANAVFSNTKLFKQTYLGFSQNFDELGADANVLLKNEGWMGAAGWAGNMSQDPLKDNISAITDEGKLQVKAGGVVGLRNYQNAYVASPLTMSNYTFEAEVSVPAVDGITDYKLMGLGFGTKEKSSASYVGYEFSVRPQIDESGNEIWKFRIYDRYNSKTPVAEKTIEDVDIALGETFTMKVALDGAMAYCYINDTFVCCFQDTDTIVGFPSLMGPNTGSATAIFDNVKLYPTDAITYEESFDSLSANTNSASVLQNLDKLNSAWFADAADASGVAGINGKFRPLRIGADGSNKFVQTYHNQYSYLFDTKGYDNGYEFEADVTYTGIGIDGLETTTTKGDYFGLLFGLNANASGSIGGYEYMIIYSEGQWRARLYDRVAGALLAYVALPKSVAAKITNHEAINFKVALSGATAYCYLDDALIITYTCEDGNAISGDVGFMAHSGAAATEDRTAAEVRTLVNYDNFRFTSEAESVPQYFDVRNNDAITLHGVSYDESEQVFNRMGLAAAQQIAGNTNFSKTSVYSHARESAGGRIRFNTNSSFVTIQATLDYKDKTYASAMGDGQFGFDIYEDTAEGSIYIGTAAPQDKPSEAGELTYEATVALGKSASRDLTIYFPLTIEVKDVKIRVDGNATVAKHSKAYAENAHIVYYGSSITQGGVVTKPGNSYVNIVGREVNVDYTNLGVWGSANGQQAFAEYIAGLKNMTVFVMDYDHNKNSVEDLENTHYSFYETVREAHPNIPIVMISRPGNGIGLKEDSTVTAYDMKEVILASYNKAKAAGDENVHFIDGEQFFGYNTEYLPDGTHPNDAGHAAMAEVVGGALTRILDGEKNVYIGETAAASVESWNLALGDNVGMNFYLNIADEVQDVKVQITVAGKTAEYTVDQLTATEAGYKVCAELAAAQVTEGVNVQVVQGEDVIVSENYTIEEYANYILSDETDKYDETTKALVVELLNYCDKAQTYFEHNTENRVSTDLSNAGKLDISAEGVADMVMHGSVNGVRFYGASMVLASKNAVRFYFTGDMSDVTISYNDKNLEIIEKDSLYYVEVADINPADLDDVITISVTKGTEELSISYSPMNYIVRMNQKGSESLQALLKALYNYHLAAEAYVSK